MTVEFFGVRGFGQLGGVNKTNRPGETGKGTKAEGKAETSFRSTLQGAQQVQASGQATDAERVARVQELKQQVANGTYDPDLNKVASSLLKFLVEG